MKPGGGFRLMLLLGAFLAILSPACQGASDSGIPGGEPDPAGQVPIGSWGGNDVALEVTKAGGAVEYSCAHGTIDQPLVADEKGMFEATGTHYVDGPGPQGSPEGKPARYNGETDGTWMTLTVTLIDTKATLGPYKLTRGQAARIVKCL